MIEAHTVFDIERNTKNHEWNYIENLLVIQINSNISAYKNTLNKYVTFSKKY